jgi:hypothetical protein
MCSITTFEVRHSVGLLSADRGDQEVNVGWAEAGSIMDDLGGHGENKINDPLSLIPPAFSGMRNSDLFMPISDIGRGLQKYPTRMPAFFMLL